jgi:hypothetical protein
MRNDSDKTLSLDRIIQYLVPGRDEIDDAGPT